MSLNTLWKNWFNHLCFTNSVETLTKRGCTVEHRGSKRVKSYSISTNIFERLCTVPLNSVYNLISQPPLHAGENMLNIARHLCCFTDVTFDSQ